MTGPTGKTLLSGRAVLAVVLLGALTGWGVYALHRSGAAWDATGRDLDEATALVAEIRPDTRVTLVGPSPLARFLVPLSRHTGRLRVTLVDSGELAALPPGPYRTLVAGDAQVQAGRAWLVLHQPDLPTLLAALAALSAPDVVVVGAAPLNPDAAPPSRGAAPDGETGDARARALVWVVTGLLMPAAVAVGAVGWRLRRRGR